MKFFKAAHKIRLVTLLALLLVFTALTSEGKANANQNDILVYVANNGYTETSLMMFDPSTNEHTPLFESIGRTGIGFKVSAAGRVVFTVHQRKGYTFESNAYLLNELSPTSEPIDLDVLLGMMVYPISWSPDGHMLAFSSYDDSNNHLIYVWDGEQLKNITPENMNTPPSSYDAEWSTDGRIALTAFWLISVYSTLDDGDRSEIYLWDGITTTNLSQNPTGEDELPVWNSQNELAFISSHEVVVWDGKSLLSGQADVESFKHVALADYNSGPAWTPDNKLAFISQTNEDVNVQVYLWDGAQITNISQNPALHNGLPNWSVDHLWAFSTFFSSEQVVYVRDSANHTLLTTEGQNHAWSLDGDLVFCDLNKRGLSMWNQEQVIPLVSGWEIWAQWRSGQEIICGNHLRK